MEWLDSVSRGANGWVFDVAGPEGVLTTCQSGELPKLAKGLKQEGSSRRRAVINLSSGWPVPTQAYLDGLGQSITVSGKHEVYGFEHQGTCYLIPAIVLMRAFFRPFAPDIIKLLYLPQGLDLLCVPDLGSEKPTVKVFDGMWPEGYRQFESHLAALSWMHCFPTARAFAASPFEKGLQGIIGVDLPKATASMVLHGVPRGDSFFVTEAVVTTLVVNEEPFDFAQGQARRIVFHDSHIPTWKGGKRQVAWAKSLRERADACLSDEEWLALEHLLPRPKVGQRTRYRDVVDCILNKMSSGIPWRQAASSGVSWENAQQHYRQWLKSGVWRDVISTIN